MHILFSDLFDSSFGLIEDLLLSETEKRVFMVVPDVYSDTRGSFSEVAPAKCAEAPHWLKSMSWIKQANRSISSPMTVRGCHALKGKSCQAKLVEALTEDIVDVIADCRPKSKTFGKVAAYLLSAEKQNKLFVPRGFLHAFAVPRKAKGNAVFLYFCDNFYCKEDEVAASPSDIIPMAATFFERDASANLECCMDKLNACLSQLSAAFADKSRMSSTVCLSQKDMQSQPFPAFLQWARSCSIDRTDWYTNNN